VNDGEPHSILTARRCRQHPYEFGRAATYVETIKAPEIEELSAKFLKAIGYYGVVEIEFKRDARDGKFKLLDVNARIWGFHGIGSACGVDFPYILYADQLKLPTTPVRAPSGIGWLRLITDIPTVLSDFAHGRLRVNDYVRSLWATRRESVFDWNDPAPTMAEMVLLPYLIVRKSAPAALAAMKRPAPLG